MNVTIECLNAKDGKRIWKWRNNNSNGVGEGSSLKYNNGRIYFGENNGIVYCLDAKKGKVIWKFDTKSGDFFSPHLDPIILGDRVYLGHISGQVFCVRADDGNLIWKWKIPEKIKSQIGVAVHPPTISNGRVFFVIKDTLYTLRDSKEAESK
jgi:outer membrane protein assembly factor BamB